LIKWREGGGRGGGGEGRGGRGYLNKGYPADQRVGEGMFSCNEPIAKRLQGAQSPNQSGAYFMRFVGHEEGLMASKHPFLLMGRRLRI